MRDVKIFGERNTSTNALKQIIESNSFSECLPSSGVEIKNGIGLKLKVLKRVSLDWRERYLDRIFAECGQDYTWKHAATNFEDASTFKDRLVLFTVRHPASWAYSLYRNHYHLKVASDTSFEDFVARKWRTVERERLDCKTFSPLELLQEKIQSYDAFAKKMDALGVPYVYIRFEDIVMAQDKVFGSICGYLDTPSNEFRELKKSTKSDDKNLEYYKDYYGKEKWRPVLERYKNLVNENVDWDTFSRWDYYPL